MSVFTVVVPLLGEDGESIPVSPPAPHLIYIIFIMLHLGFEHEVRGRDRRYRLYYCSLNLGGHG